MSIGISAGAALLIGGGLGAIGSVAGGLIQGNAAGRASDAALVGQREAIAAQEKQAARAEAFMREQAGIARADLQPFRDSQLRAVGQLEGLADPNNQIYQQQRDQATQAVQRQLAAQGLLRSNRQTAGLSEIELGLALQRQQILGNLAGSGAGNAYAGVASNLGTNLGANAQTLGTQLGTSFQNIGQINANRIGAQAGALTGAISGVNNALQGAAGQYINMELQQRLLDSFKGGGAGGGGFTVANVPNVNFNNSNWWR